MRGLIAKTLRETWLTTVFLACALCLVKFLLTFVLPQFQKEMGDLLAQLPMVQAMLSALMGIDVEEEFTARVLQSLVWVHPVVLAILWTHTIMFCTRVPAGEISGGTIDFLLSLPVSRRTVYCSESLMWVVSGLLLIVLGVAGHVAGAWVGSMENRPGPLVVLFVVVNQYGLYLAVGGVTCLFAAMSNRRGRAAAVVVGIVLGSFLLNFLSQFWQPAERLAFLGLLEYYRPAEIVRSGAFPLGDMIVLMLVAGAAWVAGGVIMIRRNICTL
ncbi:MAG: ABC transporter permease subunit [Phycisphaerales bacterium]|nr:MAG: ABC transporter permease subunit [Phycisphaerales bacterium]